MERGSGTLSTTGTRARSKSSRDLKRLQVRGQTSSTQQKRRTLSPALYSGQVREVQRTLPHSGREVTVLTARRNAETRKPDPEEPKMKTAKVGVMKCSSVLVVRVEGEEGREGA